MRKKNTGVVHGLWQRRAEHDSGFKDRDCSSLRQKCVTGIASPAFHAGLGLATVCNLRAYYFVAPPVCFCFPTLLPASDATAGQHGQCDCAWAPCSPSLAQISAFKGCGRTQEGLFDRKSLRPYCTQHCTPTGEVDVHITIASHAVRRMYTQARPLYFKPMSANLPITSFQ